MTVYARVENRRHSMNSLAWHGYCCWSKAGRQREPRAAQRIRPARDPFHQVHLAVMTNTLLLLSWQTSSETQQLPITCWGEKGQFHVTSKKLSLPALLLYRKSWHSFAHQGQEEVSAGAFAKVCMGNRDPLSTQEKHINIRCLLGHV